MKLLLISLIFISTSIVSAKKSTDIDPNLTLKKSQTVSELIKNAKVNENKKIQVTGVVTQVCPMKGCWLQLEDPKTKKQIQVKVKDDVVVFPKSAVNKSATIEGTLIKKTMSKSKAIKYYKHRADELGEKFDPNTITGPVDLWEIKGSAGQLGL